jgi:hypothetical protein
MLVWVLSYTDFGSKLIKTIMTIASLITSLYVNGATVSDINLANVVKTASVKDVATTLEILVDLLERVSNAKKSARIIKILAEISKAMKLVSDELLHKRVLNIRRDRPRYNPEVLKFFEAEALLSEDEDIEPDDEEDEDENEEDVDSEMENFINDNESENADSPHITPPQLFPVCVESEAKVDVEDAEEDKNIVRRKRRKVIIIDDDDE